MSLMLCPYCGKPRLAAAERCPHCGQSEADEPQETWIGFTCLILMCLFALALIVLPIVIIAGLLIR